VTDENLDLYVLAVAALAFTILGTVGISDAKTLSSVLLALLALLAFSQIRSRRQVIAAAKAQHVDPDAIFSDHFPDDLYLRRKASLHWLLIGVSLVRTVPVSRLEMRRVLKAGGSIRILVTDPTSTCLNRASDASRLEEMKRRISTTLDELESLKRAELPGRLEIRVAPFVPRIGINAYDSDSPGGAIYIQHYEFRPDGEAAPIFRLESTDGRWYRHFVDEAERIWGSGVPWPLGPAERLARIARPSFVDGFSSEIEESLQSADDLFITGIARNTLIFERYGLLEHALARGCRIRFLLGDPDSAASAVAAERYFAERSVSTIKERILQSLRLLKELKEATAGELSVRLCAYPLAMGVIARDCVAGSRAPESAIFLEYYSFRAAGEPKMVLQQSDGVWFKHFIDEAEALWESGVNYDL